MQTKNDTSKPEDSPAQEAGEGCSGATCSPDALATPLTDAELDDCEGRGADYIAIILGEHSRMLERQLNKAREQMAYLSKRWAICEDQKDELLCRVSIRERQLSIAAEALLELRYADTEKARAMADNALAQYDPQHGTNKDGRPTTSQTDGDAPETDKKWDTLLISGTPWRYMAESMLEACADMERERNVLRAKADNLHLSISVFLGDWRAGDFKLPELAAIHMSAIDEKHRAMGKVLFDMENETSSATGGDKPASKL
jgi:hypothetical protein